MDEWQRQIPARLYKYRKSDAAIELLKHNGAKIYLQYLDHPDAHIAIRGINSTGVVVIQAESIKNSHMQNHDAAIERVRKHKSTALCNLIVYDCNGGDVNQFIHKRYIDCNSKESVAGRELSRFDGTGWYVSRRERSILIHVATTPKTSMYNDEWINERLKYYSPVMYQRMILGESTAGGNIIFDRVEFADAPLPERVKKIWVGVDPGTSAIPLGAKRRGNLGIIVGVQTLNDEIIIVEAVQERFDGVEAVTSLIESLIERYGTEDTEITCVGDWHGGSGEAIRRDARFRERLGLLHQPSSINRYRYVTSGVNDLYDSLVQGFIKVSPRCELLMEDFNLYIWNESGTEPDKRAYDSHLIDALRYMHIRARPILKREERISRV